MHGIAMPQPRTDPRAFSWDVMKIAQIAPLYEATPPRYYGGTERVVAWLTDALVELGHDLTLFSTEDARTKAHLVAVRDQPIRLDPCPLKSDVAAHLSMLHELRSRADAFDVLHFHIDLLHFPFFEHYAGHTVTTVHGRLDMKDLPGAYQRWPSYPLVSISDAQRQPLSWANWVATVYHGLPIDMLPLGTGDSGYLAFMGRISPEKRPDRAIAVARRAGMPLRIAAKVDNADVRYFNDQIEPLMVAPHVEFIGEVTNEEKGELLGGAAALLFPIDWPEPFGLVMIEAMACGTPVIAWDCGSVPEVIEDGVTGFIVRSEDEAVLALQRVNTLDRRKIRESFERRFTASTMALAYLDVYARLATTAHPTGRHARAL